MCSRSARHRSGSRRSEYQPSNKLLIVDLIVQIHMLELWNSHVLDEFRNFFVAELRRSLHFAKQVQQRSNGYKPTSSDIEFPENLRDLVNCGLHSIQSLERNTNELFCSVKADRFSSVVAYCDEVDLARGSGHLISLKYSVRGIYAQR